MEILVYTFITLVLLTSVISLLTDKGFKEYRKYAVEQVNFIREVNIKKYYRIKDGKTLLCWLYKLGFIFTTYTLFSLFYCAGKWIDLHRGN